MKKYEGNAKLIITVPKEIESNKELVSSIINKFMIQVLFLAEEHGLNAGFSFTIDEQVAVDWSNTEKTDEDDY